ncbi:terminase small subunit [Burkholderia alba]|uniref:terminase small subunit n=1 Tax=Burkholderia alba TaxID=2683677 RepID=UPI002B05FFF3|nr:terminase small subunit [Burkholderia alba]
MVNRAGVADVFGVALTTVDAWVRAGCPVIQRGGRGVEWQFNTADVVRWREDERVRQMAGDVPDDEGKLRCRKLAAETLTAELDLSKARGEVAPVADFERVTAKLLTTIRTNMLNVPARTVLRLLGETDEAAFKTVLRDEIVTALEQSADADFDPSDDDSDVDYEGDG